jgi:hypothetical protein
MGARLEPISPNPATDQATVSFTLTQREHATLKLYNALGVEVASLLDAEMIAGEHSLPVSLSAIALPQGAYFLRLQTPTFSTTKPVQVLR